MSKKIQFGGLALGLVIWYFLSESISNEAVLWAVVPVLLALIVYRKLAKKNESKRAD